MNIRAAEPEHRKEIWSLIRKTFSRDEAYGPWDQLTRVGSGTRR